MLAFTCYKITTTIRFYEMLLMLPVSKENDEASYFFKHFKFRMFFFQVFVVKPAYFETAGEIMCSVSYRGIKRMIAGYFLPLPPRRKFFNMFPHNR